MALFPEYFVRRYEFKYPSQAKYSNCFGGFLYEEDTTVFFFERGRIEVELLPIDDDWYMYDAAIMEYQFWSREREAFIAAVVRS
jgi:hypothetical protein